MRAGSTRPSSTCKAPGPRSLAHPNADVATKVDCLRAEAEVADARQDTEAAIEHLTTAQRLLEDTQTTRGLQYHAVLTDLGGIYFRTSRFRETLELNERTAAALDRNGRGGTLGRVSVAMNRASILLRLGEVKRAEAASLDAMLRAQRLDEDKPSHARPCGVVQHHSESARPQR